MNRIHFIFILMFIASCSSYLKTSHCQHYPEFEEIDKNEGERRYSLSVWRGNSNELNSQCLCQSESVIQNYRKEVEKSINIDTQFLLERYIQRGQNAKDLHNIQEVLNSRVGSLRDMTCMEMKLLEKQMTRNEAMLTAPTEFLAYFLEKSDEHKVFTFTNDSLGVGSLGILFSAINKEVQAGWKVMANLHNHSFFLDSLDSVEPQGVIAPSSTDVMVFNFNYRDFEMPEYRITNGFQTLVINKNELSLLK